MPKRLVRLTLDAFKYEFEHELPMELDLVFHTGKVMHGYLEKLGNNEIYFRDAVRNKHLFKDSEICEVVFSVL